MFAFNRTCFSGRSRRRLKTPTNAGATFLSGWNLAAMLQESAEAATTGDSWSMYHAIYAGLNCLLLIGVSIVGPQVSAARREQKRFKKDVSERHQAFELALVKMQQQLAGLADDLTEIKESVKDIPRIDRDLAVLSSRFNQ